ncbi:MAG TPA: hypothetical protein VK453_19325 [Micromonosporaceae bacterium]|nr:hypothetical protein [Micromonosporaceae bacterium]
MAEPEDDLIAQLRALGTSLQTPAPPDLRAAVRTRLSQSADAPGWAGWRRAGWRRAGWRRADWSRAGWRRADWSRAGWGRAGRRGRAVVAAVVVAVLLALLPPARAAMAEVVAGLLRFAGVEVVHGVLRPRATPSPLPSTRSGALDEARRMAKFPLGTPARLGPPEEVQLGDPGPDGSPRVVSLVYGGGSVRLDQFDGSVDPAFFKTVGGAGAVWVDVDGRSAVWLAEPHVLEYVDRHGVRHAETARMTGPTLIWSGDQVTYRLEGVATLPEARAIAASVR